jgi:hypothetical protein
MKKLVISFIAILSICCSTDNEKHSITDTTINQVIANLKKNNSDNSSLIKKGVKQVASLWHKEDGSENDFINFCKKEYITNPTEKEKTFKHLDMYFESLNGYFNEISLKLKEPMQLTNSDLLDIDSDFAAYDVSAHMISDFYKNKIAFKIALNFPEYNLEEKNTLGKKWSRKEWAYARLGDIFTTRVPSELKINYAKVSSNTSNYIAQYNIYMGELLNEKGETLFPKNMKLLSHWNLRDEIKSNYPNKKNGIVKQDMIYQVMKRIINQEIPEEVINSNKFQWKPISNKLISDNKEIKFKQEPYSRYQQIIDNFKALESIDKYSPNLNTFIKRNFSGAMEISQEEVEKTFIKLVSSKEIKKVGELIKKRLGRDLKPYDIWYDGFKLRSMMNEEKLSEKTRKKYPNSEALDKDLSRMLKKLGFSNEKTKLLSDHISVDPARGSGHAWGAQMRNAESHLRTRIAPEGMDYKGYNIAIHEFGHNVEQTFSLRTGYYSLRGVPNTGFTEALAFIFQKRDLFLLNENTSVKHAKELECLDTFWGMYEIMGVSLVDMNVWKWLYNNPTANAKQLKDETIKIAKEVWNKYYAPVFEMKDQEILAIYSHMISYPLYLSAYPYGKIIDFQIEEYLEGKNFATEIERIFKLGRLTPNIWMNQAVGSDVSIEPILKKANKAVDILN